MIVDPSGKKPEEFGQVKNDIAKESKKFGALDNPENEPIKIFKVEVIAKKVYLVSFILPDGTIESTQACKGISEEIPAENFEKACLNPQEGKKTVNISFQIKKNFYTKQSMKREAELYLENLEKKKAKIVVDDEMEMEAKISSLKKCQISEEQRAELLEKGAEEHQNAGFLLRRSTATRTFNQNPSFYRMIDLKTGKAYPWGHPGITKEMEENFRKEFGGYEIKEKPLRWCYKNVAEVDLTRKFLEAEDEKLLEEEGNRILREANTFELCRYDLAERIYSEEEELENEREKEDGYGYQEPNFYAQDH